jgi:hypothetical protein
VAVAAIRKVVERVGWIVAALSSLFLVATIGQPLRMNWGDPWSDCNAQNAGHFFVKYGWGKTAFTPILDIEPLTPESLRYTHYPPLPDILNGAQRQLFGASELSTFRIAAVGLSVLSLFLFYRWVESLWGTTAASFSLALFAGNLLWLQYADTVHHVPIYSATGFGALLCASRWLRAQKARHLFGVGALTFLCFLASYDYVFFLPLTIVATALMREKRIWSPSTRRLLAALVVGAVAAIVTKYVLVIWAVGWTQFTSDLIFQFHERATTKHASSYREGLSSIALFRLWRFFTPLFFVVLAVHVALVASTILARVRSRELPAAPAAAGWTATPLLVLLAGVPFLVVFSQLFCEQYHPTLLVLPYFAIGTGTLLARCWESPRLSAATVGALALLLGWQVNEVARFPKRFLSRPDVAAVRTHLNEKDDRRFVLTNGATGAPFLYYWNRYALSTAGIAPEHIPRYATSLEDELGAGPVRFIHFANAEEIAFDKYVYGVFAPEKRWSWIADPGGRRSEWQPVLRARDDAMLAYVGQFGELELDTGTAQIWRIDRPRVMDFLAKKVLAHPTTTIDFGDVTSEDFKVHGFRYPERSTPGGPGFCWMQRTRPSRMIFTLKGLRHVPTGAPARNDAALRLAMAPGRAYRIEARLGSAVPDQHVTVTINGSTLAEVALAAGEFKEVVMEVPSDVLDASGLQRLGFAFTGANDDNLAVAVGRFEITAR